MSTSTVTDMNPNSSKLSVNGGRRKTKGSELTQKKPRQPRRGMGVAQLENLRVITEASSLNPQHLPPAFNPAAVQYYRTPALVPTPIPTPAMVFHGPNVYSVDHVVDPTYRFENPREFYSVPSYMKCASDGCGICHKKKRIAGGINHSSVSPFRSFSGNNAVVEMPVAGIPRGTSRQVTEVTSVNRNGGGSMTEFEFFPGKGGGAEELMRMGSTATASTRCCSCVSGGGVVGFHGGEGSCVSAITGSEEGSVSSVDLSLKLSY